MEDYEALQVLKRIHNHSRNIQDYIQNILKQSQTANISNDVLQGHLGKAQAELGQIRKLIFDLELLADEQTSDHQERLVKEQLKAVRQDQSRLQEELKTAVQVGKQATLQWRQQAKMQHHLPMNYVHIGQREALLAGGGGANGGTALKTNASAIAAAKGITDRLRRTRQMLLAEVEHSAANLEVLKTSDVQLDHTRDEYQKQKVLLKEAGGLTKKLSLQEILDRYHLWAMLSMFLCVCIYIVQKRLRVFIPPGLVPSTATISTQLHNIKQAVLNHTPSAPHTATSGTGPSPHDFDSSIPPASTFPEASGDAAHHLVESQRHMLTQSALLVRYAYNFAQEHLAALVVVVSKAYHAIQPHARTLLGRGREWLQRSFMQQETGDWSDELQQTRRHGVGNKLLMDVGDHAPGGRRGARDRLADSDVEAVLEQEVQAGYMDADVINQVGARKASDDLTAPLQEPGGGAGVGVGENSSPVGLETAEEEEEVEVKVGVLDDLHLPALEPGGYRVYPLEQQLPTNDEVDKDDQPPSEEVESQQQALKNVQIQAEEQAESRVRGEVRQGNPSNLHSAQSELAQHGEQLGETTASTSRMSKSAVIDKDARSEAVGNVQNVQGAPPERSRATNSKQVGAVHTHESVGLEGLDVGEVWKQPSQAQGVGVELPDTEASQKVLGQAQTAQDRQGGHESDESAENDLTSSNNHEALAGQQPGRGEDGSPDDEVWERDEVGLPWEDKQVGSDRVSEVGSPQHEDGGEVQHADWASRRSEASEDVSDELEEGVTVGSEGQRWGQLGQSGRTQAQHERKIVPGLIVPDHVAAGVAQSGEHSGEGASGDASKQLGDGGRQEVLGESVGEAESLGEADSGDRGGDELDTSARPVAARHQREWAHRREEAKEKLPRHHVPEHASGAGHHRGRRVREPDVEGLPLGAREATTPSHQEQQQEGGVVSQDAHTHVEL